MIGGMYKHAQGLGMRHIAANCPPVPPRPCALAAASAHHTILGSRRRCFKPCRFQEGGRQVVPTTQRADVKQPNEDAPASAAAAAAASVLAGAVDPKPGPGSSTAEGPRVPLQAVVIGAGPAGVTAAIYLARRGWKVDIFERRSEGSPLDQRRTYLIGLGQRGLRALEGAGVFLSDDRRLLGSVYATHSARFEDVWSDQARIIGVDRSSLTARLVSEARRSHPGAISFHWEHDLAGVDFGKRAVTVAARSRLPDAPSPEAAAAAQQPPGVGGPSPPLTAVVPYNLLIGADGARSAVRGEMLRALPGMRVAALSSPAVEYKAFHGLEDCEEIRAMLPDEARAPGAEQRPGSYFFAMTNPTPEDPSPGSVTLYVNQAGSYSGVMYQPAGRFSSMAGDKAAHADAVMRLVPPGFPRGWVEVMADQMAPVGASGTTPMHLTSRISWPEASAVLLGDSAHNVTPQLGQGCNSALEDCLLLDGALDAARPEMAALGALAAQAASPPLTAAAAAAAPAAPAAPKGVAGIGGSSQLGGSGGFVESPEGGALDHQHGGLAASSQSVIAARRAASAAAAPAIRAALEQYERRRAPQAHALQRIEEENAWVRRPPAPGREPARATYMRVAWACTALLLAAASKGLAWLPEGVKARARPPPASLFENVMGTTAPYDKLRLMIILAPAACAGLAVCTLLAAKWTMGSVAAAAAALTRALG